MNSGDAPSVGNGRILPVTNSRGTSVEGRKEESFPERLPGDSAAQVLPLTAPSARRVNLLPLNY